MPKYEYACQGCHDEMEIEQRMADDALVTCPSCGEDKLERLISATSFALKGGGWYADGYGAKGGAKGGANATKKSATTSESTSSESKSSDSNAKPSSDAATKTSPSSSTD